MGKSQSSASTLKLSNMELDRVEVLEEQLDVVEVVGADVGMDVDAAGFILFCAFS
jgi:hypothetical protein